MYIIEVSIMQTLLPGMTQKKNDRQSHKKQKKIGDGRLARGI